MTSVKAVLAKPWLWSFVGALVVWLATIAFTGCRELMPDPEFYAQCIEDSFTEMRDAARKSAQGRAPAAEKPAKATSTKSKAGTKPAATRSKPKPAAKRAAPNRKSST